MLAGLENLPSNWNSILREPGLSPPLSQSGAVSPLLPGLRPASSMPSPTDAFAELFPGLPISPISQHEQSLSSWYAQSVDYPTHSSQPYQGAPYSCVTAYPLPEPQFFEGECPTSLKQ